MKRIQMVGVAIAAYTLLITVEYLYLNIWWSMPIWLLSGVTAYRLSNQKESRYAIMILSCIAGLFSLAYLLGYVVAEYDIERITNPGKKTGA